MDRYKLGAVQAGSHKGPFYSGRDIMKFEIEKDPCAPCLPYGLQYAGPLADEEFQAYLEQAYVFFQEIHIMHGLIIVRQVQGENDKVFWFFHGILLSV